jgi:hypothetical protein
VDLWHALGFVAFLLGDVPLCFQLGISFPFIGGYLGLLIYFSLYKHSSNCLLVAFSTVVAYPSPIPSSPRLAIDVIT